MLCAQSLPATVATCDMLCQEGRGGGVVGGTGGGVGGVFLFENEFSVLLSLYFSLNHCGGLFSCSLVAIDRNRHTAVAVALTANGTNSPALK